MRVVVKLDGATVDQVRIVAIVCHRNREAWPYDHQPWQPRVNVEGPSHFGIQVSPVSLDVAQEILHELEQHEMRTQP